jgi:hypothetical protein
MATYTKVVDPNNGAGTDYTSLAAWEAGEQTRYSSGDIAIADCKRTGAFIDTSVLTLYGWTVGVIPKIIANASYRPTFTSGSWTGYILSTGADDNIRYWHDGCIIDGLIVKPTSNKHGVYVISGSGTLEIANSIIDGGGSSTGSGITTAVALTANVKNSIICGFSNTSSGGVGVYVQGSSAIVNCDNVTIYNCRYGALRTSGTMVMRNCLVLNKVEQCFYQASNGSDYNISSDATAPGINVAINKTSYTDYFVDPANRDFHLKASSFDLFGINSENLYSTFTTDIDGDNRPNSNQFGLGADYYQASGSSFNPAWARNANQFLGANIC